MGAGRGGYEESGAALAGGWGGHGQGGWGESERMGVGLGCGKLLWLIGVLLLCLIGVLLLWSNGDLLLWLIGLPPASCEDRYPDDVIANRA